MRCVSACGTSYSMLATAREAYKVLQLRRQSWPALEAFYQMTLGNARLWVWKIGSVSSKGVTRPISSCLIPTRGRFPSRLPSSHSRQAGWAPGRWHGENGDLHVPVNEHAV